MCGPNVVQLSRRRAVQSVSLHLLRQLWVLLQEFCALALVLTLLFRRHQRSINIALQAHGWHVDKRKSAEVDCRETEGDSQRDRGTERELGAHTERDSVGRPCAATYCGSSFRSMTRRSFLTVSVSR